MGGVNMRHKIKWCHKKMATKKRGPSYSHQELTCLLKIVREVLLIGQDDWENVTTDHTTIWPDSCRDYLGIRRKFNQLANKNIPTGDPTCPPEVREAKEILSLIKEKTEIDNFDDDDDKGPEDDIPPPIVRNNTVILDNDATSVGSARNISPNLQRLSRPRKRKNDEDLSIQDIFKMQMIEREEDRKDARERERIRLEEEREYRRRSDARDGMFQNMCMAAMMNMTNRNEQNFDPTDIINSDSI